MRNNSLLAVFIPWIFFSVFYGNTPESMFFASIAALILMVALNFKELNQGFILPWGSVVFFAFLALNAHYDMIPWAQDHALLLLNSGLAAIVWFSMLIFKPFSIQYARLEVNPLFWHHPIFIKTNWLITSVWAILMTIMALPSYFMPQAQLLDSWFWNYGLTILCIVVALWLTKKIPGFYIGRAFWQTVKKLPPVNTPYLRDGFAPVKDEVDLKELKVEGSLPVTLNGIYLRNGPNPLFTPYTYTYPIDGDGMIHAITLAHGWVSYKNRFVKTKGLLAEQKAGKALYAGIKLPLTPDPKYVQDQPFKNTASIHVALFGKYLLAFYESTVAYILDKNLNTRGEWQPGGTKNFPINAHHRHDPKTGKIYACAYNADAKPYLTFYEFDQDAHLLKSIPIDKPYATMIHDFVITEHYIVVFDSPTIFDFSKKEILTYQADKPLNVMLIHRETHEVKTIKTESFFLYHYVNAYEQGHKIIVDFVHHKSLCLDPLLHKEARGPRLYRAEIDPEQYTYQHYCLCDSTLEFPTYALSYTGQPYRYGYFCAKSSEAVTNVDTILKYDFIERKAQFFNLGSNIEVDEAIFVPESKQESEDHGYLMLFVYHKDIGTSDFVLLDAQKPAAHPVAVVKLGRRVPHGLHGSWIPKV